MNILIIGSGGREHALYHKIKTSPKVKKLYISPGNGLVDPSDRVNLNVEDFDKIKNFIQANNVALTVIGPEIPLVNGLRDFLKSELPNHFVFGPDKRSAQLEGSKAFSDAFMQKANIPHGTSVICTHINDAFEKLTQQSLPVVIKADGLAAGKGVSIHHDYDSARAKLRDIFENKIFGASGNTVLLQKFLSGTEASLFAICNGKEALLLPVARDYKRALDQDAGDNTGGMGAFAPATQLSDGQKAFVRKNIIQPVLNEFGYRGLLYCGLMIESEKDDGISVVEFNCRFGDPETQSILPLLYSDFLDYLLWSDDGFENIPKIQKTGFLHIPYERGHVVNVVISAQGYPGIFEKGIPLQIPQTIPNEVQITGAGIELQNEQLQSTGGRILNIIAKSPSLEEARLKAYAFIETFLALNSEVRDKLHFRTDIGRID